MRHAMDIFEIMKSALLLQRAATRRVRSLPAYDVLEMATSEGARALGRDAKSGPWNRGSAATWCSRSMRLEWFPATRSRRTSS